MLCTGSSRRKPGRRLLASLTATLLAGIAPAIAAPSAHAVNGTTAPEGTFRFVAEVRTHDVVCTGSLIHPRWVLTAEHCSHPNSLGNMTVRMGTSVRGSGGEFRIVSRIVRNPAYNGGHNDLALLELDTPVTSIKPVRLATPDLSSRWDGVVPIPSSCIECPFTSSDEGVAVGWGKDSTGGLPARLQHALVNIRPSELDGHGIKSIPVSVGPCQGDSGGPLLITWNGEQVQAGALKGATSSCGSSGGGSYSEVGAGPNRDWILSQTTKVPFTPFGVADWDRDGHQDVIARHDATGDLWLYPGQSVRGYSSAPRVLIGNGWNGFTPFGIADWDRDGHQDIITRNDSNGELWLYPGQSRRGYSGAARVLIGNGWNGFTPFDVADWDRDGHQDIVTRNDSTGGLWLYPGQSRRGYSGAAPVWLGNGWKGYSSFGIADFDRDGHQDIVSRDNDTGNLWLELGDSRRAHMSGARVQIGNGWAGFTSFGLADHDRDGHQDIIARADYSGDLWLYPGQSRRGYPGVPQARIGNGW